MPIDMVLEATYAAKLGSIKSALAAVDAQPAETTQGIGMLLINATLRQNMLMPKIEQFGRNVKVSLTDYSHTVEGIHPLARGATLIFLQRYEKLVREYYIRSLLLAARQDLGSQGPGVVVLNIDNTFSLQWLQGVVTITPKGGIHYAEVLGGDGVQYVGKDPDAFTAALKLLGELEANVERLA